MRRDARPATLFPSSPIDMDATGTVGFVGSSARATVRAAGEPDDVALVLHTSGSTGRPKRVPLAHANLAISAGNVARSYDLGPEDVAMCVMPLFHVHGLVASTLGTLSTGGTLVIPGKFNPLSFWRVARDYGVTWYSAVPTIHQLLLARVDPAAGRPAGAERLRFIRSCSAALPPQVMHDLEEAFGAPVLEAYGMTEAAHQMASNPLPPAARKPGSVGQGTEVQISIMDAAGKHLPAGERGEVVIKGPNVTRGYENNPEANAKSFTDGWFRTGDQGFLDADGYLTLVARIKELINRGGEKISPREIDEVLLAHPSVTEAVCFGVPHKTWGEEVAAAVVVSEAVSETDLIAFCKERLAEFKRPEADSHHRHHSAHRDRQDSARRRGPGVRAPRDDEDRVKIVIAGAGAIGGYIGARLARAAVPGVEVVLFARGPHLRAMQERGLRVASPDGNFEVKPTVTGDLSTIGPPTSCSSASRRTA